MCIRVLSFSLSLLEPPEILRQADPPFASRSRLRELDRVRTTLRVSKAR